MNFRDRVKQRAQNLFGKKDSNEIEPQEPSEEEIKRQEEESAKGERRMKILLERVIQKYYEQHLAGEIEIVHSAFMVETTIACEIDGTSGDVPEGLGDEAHAANEAQFLQEEGDDAASASTETDADSAAAPAAQAPTASGSSAEAAELKSVPLTIRTLLKGINGMLSKLERRAQNYRGEHYKEGLTLGGAVSVTDPTGYFGISLSCSATVESLLDSARIRKEKAAERAAKRAAEKERAKNAKS